MEHFVGKLMITGGTGSFSNELESFPSYPISVKIMFHVTRRNMPDDVAK